MTELAPTGPNVRTHIGPNPPSKPKDQRTWIWSRCWSCGWLAEHLEESQAMQHSIEVAEHRCQPAVQLDLFAELEQPAVDPRAEWAARFERAPWSRPYDTGYGPAGTVVQGWVCPACGKVEDNACSMSREHGYDPDIPGHFYGQHRGDLAFGENCTRTRLLASQQRAREAKAARETSP